MGVSRGIPIYRYISYWWPIYIFIAISNKPITCADTPIYRIHIAKFEELELKQQQEADKKAEEHEVK